MTIRRMRGLVLSHFLALSCSLILSCNKAASESETKIFGGHPASSEEWLGAVGIGSDDGLFCTGIAVSPKLVVTAAHCLYGTRPEGLRVYIGQGVDGEKVVGEYQVESLALSPEYRVYRDGDDIGFLVLKDSLSLPEEAYIPLATPAERENDGLEAIGRPVTIVGYGERESSAIGEKYEVETSIISKIVGLEGITTHQPKQEFLAGGEGLGVCGGDSGGPVYTRGADGAWRAIGITSRGWKCGEGAVYSSIASHLCWIQQESRFDLGLPEQDCAALPEAVPVEPHYEDVNNWW